MTISGIKQEVASLLAERRGGTLTTSSGGPILLKVVAIGGAVGLVGFFVLPRLFAAPATASRADTGNAQIDQAMQMLQQQQDINRELLKGQQELNAQMIEAQSKAKPVTPSVNCFLAVCPGTGQQEAQPDGQYAIVGEGIRTARIDPNQFMQGLVGQQPVQQFPVTPAPSAQTASYEAIQVANTAPDAEQEYRRLSTDMMNDWPRFMAQWRVWESVINSNSTEPTAVAFQRIAKEQGW